ncbi:ATP-dependent DNA helicase RecG [Alkalilimnicola ehrlichii]|uniref:ATP-dependent DNA helicase RecG n=1 Tax=Alkalilimnicola ehrlichii TaxID=351052 RepID=A0A3E0X3W2_9GAMM|nr:ATP-dependent DNA helicase RecG [Alkalilimnicola ehrlichii]RFA31173.1 ATP-dependent DNA helicase RecG [Alkalilimnicola ehrlichii]RFA39542.1 ATP-dependent DNA helicase RecG [Alkalilimnicola ehrlichii]
MAVACTLKPVTELRGVGPRLAERLAKLGISQVRDLLFHLPLRYEDRSTRVPIGRLRAGEHVLIEGVVELCEVAPGRRRRLLCRVSDGTGSLTLVFFHFYPKLQADLARGTTIQCFGEVRDGPGMPQMIHPEYRHADANDEAWESEGLTPIYPSTQGLQQNSLRRLVKDALLYAETEQGLPDLLAGLGLELPGLYESLSYLHCPPTDAPRDLLENGSHPCRHRLALEELVAHHLTLRRLRASMQQLVVAPALPPADRLKKPFLSQLPFQLTQAQARVVAEVEADLATEQAMLRLVQGDVGSGKTVVAALAILGAVEAGWQAVVMAPTELLAEQHMRNFAAWLEPLGVEMAWLSGRLSGRSRQAQLQAVADGRAQVVVGTHALFQETVSFARLGLVVIDEQHRFGVHQRLALREKGREAGVQPHQLIMTATPIPRTLAMTAYADLDVSVIDELPPGRTPVRTVAVASSRRPEVVERVRAACAEGRQAYWVCTLVEESEVLQAEAAEVAAENLAEALPELRVGLVHGRQKSAEKEAVMAAFKRHELDLLVATTVIEVGVDVPNASLMIIENAERLGLSQLHQLRGRVGRGAAASSCVLMYQGPLSRTAKERLAVMRETTDGFEVARRDLEIRGPGEFLGTRQTGALQYRVADLERDAGLLPTVHRIGDRLLAEYPERVDALVRRWVGDAERYGQV